MEVVIDPRYNGPFASGNGGYTCGLVAGLLGARSAEVTLRLPPPLGRPLRWDGTRLWDGDALVAEGAPAGVELGVPAPPSFEDAERALPGFAGFVEHAFPTCFVCGPQREPGDGLRIFASPVERLRHRMPAAGERCAAAPLAAPPSGCRASPGIRLH